MYSGNSPYSSEPSRPVTPPPPTETKERDPKSAQAKVLRVGGSVMEAKIIRRVMPEYPKLARDMRISGVVRLVGVIGRDGAIKELKVAQGHPLLVNAALNAVRQWIYSPTLLNGEPVEVIAPIDVNFTLAQ